MLDRGTGGRQGLRCNGACSSYAVRGMVPSYASDARLPGPRSRQPEWALTAVHSQEAFTSPNTALDALCSSVWKVGASEYANPPVSMS